MTNEHIKEDDTVDRRRSLNGYAPGGYMCKCHNCGEQFTGDKRAITCFSCAINQSAWLPIESAPTRSSETWVLIYSPKPGVEMRLADGDWWRKYGGPTKWMHLPLPPG